MAIGWLVMVCLNGVSGAALEEALAFERAGKNEQAIAAVESLIRQWPQWELARIEAARLRLTENSDLSLAEFHLEAARSIAPENPRAQFLWGELMEERGLPLEAIRAYELAILYREDFHDARLRLAGLYYSRGDWARAEQQYRFLAQAHPEWLQVRTQLASAIEKQGRMDDCERELQALVKHYPQAPIGMRALASFYERTDRPEMAAKVLAKLNLVPKKRMRDLKRSAR